MKNNWTTEEVNELLDEYDKYLRDDVLSKWMNRETLEAFKKEKGLLPTMEAGKVYTDGSVFVMCTDVEKSTKHTIYGYGVRGRCWAVNNSFVVGEFREATTEEWQSVLEDYAINVIGYKKGVTVKDISDGDTGKIRERFFFQLNRLYVVRSDSNMRGYEIMRDGEWAEIIEEVPEYTMDFVMERAKEAIGHEFKIKQS